MSMTRLQRVTAIVVAVFFSGCSAGQQPCPAAPAAGTSEEGSLPSETRVGQLDAEIVAVAIRADGVYRMRVVTDGSGEIQKLAIYHNDAEEIPEAVRTAAQERFPGAEVRNYETEVYADVGRVFEVEVTTAEGRDCEISCRPDGSLVYVECRVPTDEVPAWVLAEATRLLPDGEVVEAETKEGPGINEVHLEVRVEELIHYLVFVSEDAPIRHSLRIPATIEIPVGQ